MREVPTPERGRAFLASSRFLWHQAFELVPGVMTPGASNVVALLDRAGIPPDLRGLSVLDIGTSNGGTAFEAERRGASRVVAVDIYAPDRFGFADIKAFYGSDVEFVQGSIYELPERLRERFDLVLFFGVLYHLRHPLLALDRLRELTKQTVAIESAVCDHEHEAVSRGPYARFYRGAELAGDSSNWFAPSVRALTDWVASSGFDVLTATAWPRSAPQRAMVTARPTSGPAEYQRLSYEVPLVSIGHRRGDPSA